MRKISTPKTSVPADPSTTKTECHTRLNTACIFFHFHTEESKKRKERGQGDIGGRGGVKRKGEAGENFTCETFFSY